MSQSRAHRRHNHYKSGIFVLLCIWIAIYGIVITKSVQFQHSEDIFHGALFGLFLALYFAARRDRYELYRRRLKEEIGPVPKKSLDWELMPEGNWRVLVKTGHYALMRNINACPPAEREPIFVWGFPNEYIGVSIEKTRLGDRKFDLITEERERMHLDIDQELDLSSADEFQQ